LRNSPSGIIFLLRLQVRK